MSKCDLCDKEHDDYFSASLLSCYQTAKIKDLCPDCTELVNNHLGKLKDLSMKWYTKIFKIFLRNKRREFTMREK